MSPRDPRPPLHEADAAFQSTALPPQVLARLRRRIFDEPRRSSVRWVAAGVAAASLAVVAYGALRSRPTIEDVQLATGEHYRTAEVELAALAPALIHRDHAVLTLRSGDVLVTVEHRQPLTTPVRIVVSHGTIEVVGTRFTLRQSAGGGSVEVHEGRVRFLSDEVTAEVTAGESLTWPRPRASAAPIPTEQAPNPAEPAPPSRAPPATPRPSKPRVTRAEPAVIRETDAAWLLEEVELLRSRAEYDEAVRLLDNGLAGLVSTKTRERFSFELGSILTYQQRDPSRACHHWASHQASFPAGRYAQEVQSAREKARCESR